MSKYLIKKIKRYHAKITKLITQIEKSDFYKIKLRCRIIKDPA